MADITKLPNFETPNRFTFLNRENIAALGYYDLVNRQYDAPTLSVVF